MAEAVVLHIDLDKKCVECRRGGATPSGLCLRCCNKALLAKPMRTPQGRALQIRMREILRKATQQ